MRPNLARVVVSVLCLVVATVTLATDKGKPAPAVTLRLEAPQPQANAVFSNDLVDQKSLTCSAGDSIGLTLPAAGTDLASSDNRKSCGHGIQSCDASQVGQPCDPSNLNVICSAQSNGKYCCLAYAP